MIKKGLSGELMVIMAGICWGIIGLFTRKMSSAGLDSIQITFLRNIISAVILLAFAIVKNPEGLKINIRDVWMFVGTGILSIVFFNICYFKAIQITSMSVAAVLLYTAPALVVVMSRIFFKEKLNLQKVVALLLSFAGCIFTTGMLGSHQSIDWLGVLIGIGAGFGYALYSIFGTVATKKYDSFTITFYTFAFAGIALLPFGKIGQIGGVVADNPSVILTALTLAIVSTVIPYLLYTAGLKKIEAGKASIIAFIEPLVATVCGIVIFKEKMTISNITGVLLIFVSIILLNVRVGKQKDGK